MAEQCARKSNENPESGCEHFEARRQYVEMGNDEDGKPLEAEVPRARMNPKNPTNQEKQEHEDVGHAVDRSWCAACAEGKGVGGQHRLELLEKEQL